LWAESFASLLSFIRFDRSQTTVLGLARKAHFFDRSHQFADEKSLLPRHLAQTKQTQ
jgi:hypothetical protein